MPGVKELAKDFYAKYDKEGYSEEKLSQIEDYYKGDVERLARDFYAKYDKDNFSEEKLSKVVEYYSDKKKEQTQTEETPQEEVPQEGMESVSEGGSSESLEVDVEGADLSAGEEKTTDLMMGEQEQIAPVEPNVEVDYDVSGELSETELRELTPEEKSKREEIYQKDFQEKVDKASKILPKDLDYLTTQDEIVSQLESKLGDNALDGFDSEALAVAINKNKEEQLALESKKELEKTKEARKMYYLDRGIDFDTAEELANKKVSEDLTGIQFESLGLSEEDAANYRSVVFELNELQSKERTPETIAKMDELLSKVDKITEFSNKNFIDPKTGNVIEEKAEVAQLASEYKQEYSNDYTRLKNRLDKETLESLALEQSINNILPGDSNIASYMYENDSPIDSADDFILTQFGGASYKESDLEKAKALYRDYKQKKNSIEALSRVLLLNDNVFETAKGFKAFEGIPILEGAGEIIVSAAESFVEELPGGVEVLSDNDYASIVNSAAAESGVELTKEQIDRATPNFKQKLGSTLGMSLEVGLEIGLLNKGLGSFSKALNLPSKIARHTTISEGSKTMKALEFMGNMVKEDIAFQLASDDIGLGTGATEKLTEEGLEKLVSRIAGSKYGKFVKYLDNYVTRSAGKTIGRSAGGTTSEYAGEFVAEGIDKGFFTEEQFKSVFGEGEEAVEKFLLTASMTGMMTLPTTFLSEIKSKGASDDVKNLVNQVEEYNRKKDLLDKDKAELTPEEKTELESIINSLDVEQEQKTIEEEEAATQGVVTEETSTEEVAQEVTQGQTLEEAPPAEQEVTSEEVQEDGEETIENQGGTISKEQAIEGVARRLQETEQEIEAIESTKNDTPTARDLVLENWEKLDPESIRKEMGVKVGSKGDINPSMTKKGGKSLMAFAESLLENTTESGGNLNIDERDIFEAVVEVLNEGSINKARSKFSVAGKLEDLKKQKAELETELDSLTPKEFDELSKEEQDEILAKEAAAIFTEEELNEVLTKDKLQSYIDSVDAVIKSRKNNLMSDPFGINAAIDGILVLVRNGLKAGMTLRDAFQKAKKEYTLTDDYKNLSASQKTEVDNLKEDVFKKEINPKEKKSRDATYRKAGSIYSKSRKKGADVMSSANKAFDSSFGFADWFKNLSKEEQSDIKVDFMNRVVENLENPSPSKNQVFTKPKRKKGKTEYVTKKKSFSDQSKVDKRARSEKAKEIKAAQDTFLKELKDKSFKKDSQGNTISLLSPAKRTLATNLVKGVKDKKTLGEARTTLYNILQTGKSKPTTPDFFESLLPKEFITMKAGELNAALLRAEKKAANLSTKEKGKLLSETFKRLKEARAKLTEREFKSLARQVLKTNPASFDQVSKLNERISDLIKTSEQRATLSKAKSLQAKLKKEIKKAKHKDGFGVIKSKAKELATLNPRDVSSVEMLNDVLENFLTSISTGKGTLESSKELADVLINEATEKSELRKLEKQAFIAEQMRDEYNSLKEEGVLPDSIRNFEEYVDFLNDAKAFESKELSLEKQADLVLNLIDKLESLESFKEGDTFKEMSPKQKAIINILSKTKEVLVDSRNMTTEQVLQLNNAVNEILTYDSTSGVAKAAAIINGVRKGAAIKLYLTGKLQSSVFAKKGLSPNLSSFLAAVTESPEAAKKLASVMFSEYNENYRIAQAKADNFDVESGKKRRELGLKDKNSTRIGLISDLRQTPEGVNPTEDLQNKIEHIEKQIDKLSRQAQEEFKKQAKDLKKNYDELGLKDVKSKEELLSKLEPNEAEYLNWLEDQFANELPDLQEAYRNQKGQELEPVSNYTPTYVYKISKVKDKNGNDVTSVNITNGTNVDPSGRTIKRQRKLSANEIKNYDIFRTSVTGFQDIQGDIHTLMDRATLDQLVKSKPFRDAVAINMDGKEDSKIYDLITNRIGDLINKRTTFNPRNIATMNKVAQLAQQYVQGLILQPLKTRDQVIKQPISIVFNSLNIAPTETAMAFGYFASSKSKNALNALLDQSNVVLRNPMGDSEIPNSKLFSEEAYKSIIQYLNEGKPLSNKALNEIKKATGKGLNSGAGKLILNNDVLTHFDRSATGGSWLAFYIKERKKQEGKGFKFDLEKESKSPNKEAIEKANVESDWVNNKSDYTTQGDAAFQKGLWKYIFLFKSFSLNQNVNAMINTRNAIQSIKRGDYKTLNQSVARLGGALMGAAVFSFLKEGVLNPAYDEILEAFGVEGDDDEELAKSVSDVAASSIATGFFDMYLGGVPDFTTLSIKKMVNDYVVESAKEDFEEKYRLLDDKPKFNPYDYKLFYDNYKGEGVLAAFENIAGTAYDNAITVVSGADLGTTVVNGVESDIETPNDIKIAAGLSMASMMAGLGDLRKLSDKYKEARSKEEKAKK